MAKGSFSRQLVIAVSHRSDGPMGLLDQSNEQIALRNRKRFFERHDIPFDRIVRCEQVHGAHVAVLRRIPTRPIPRTDALITDRLNTFLAILVADCFPVFVYDPQFRAVGIAHVGSRGAVKGAVAKLVRAMAQSFGVVPGRLKAVIGPGIRVCHYEVWLDSRHKNLLRQHPTLARRFLYHKGTRAFLDLPRFIRWQLNAAGVPSASIRDVRECTFELQRRYFSYRRDRSQRRPRGYGNMIAVIGIRVHDKESS